MAEFCEVFERIEKKYRLSAEQYRLVKAALRGRMAPDKYGRTRITSLYFDTPERSLIARSLEKPRYKEKLRLRMYGAEGESLCGGVAHLDDAPGEQPVYLEIKKKYEGVVYKRRVGFTLAAARAYWYGMPYEQACRQFPLQDEGMAKESLSARSVQISREIDRFRQRYETLESSMAVSCERTAWAPARSERGRLLDETCENLRITFDENLRYSDWCGENTAAQPIIAPDGVIMEIKCAGSYPLWLAHALAQLGVYPSSFSKYGTAYLSAAGTSAACKRASRPPRAPVASQPVAAAQAAALAKNRLLKGELCA